MKINVKIVTESSKFAEKYNIPLKIALKLHKSKKKWKVNTFYVYDKLNPEDKELIRMNEYLATHPEYEKQWFHEQGPCSNWGYDIYRIETDKEFDRRIKKEIKKWTKRLNS